MDVAELAGFQQVVRLISVDPATNRRRFYELRWTPSVFGSFMLVRHYGRLGKPGRISSRHGRPRRR